MKKSFLILILFVSAFTFGQNINDYKYAIIPSKFSFLKEKDEYRLNTLTKLFMEKYGFVSYFDTDVLPDDLINSNCNKVYVDVISSGNFINTKIKIILKNDFNKTGRKCQ